MSRKDWQEACQKACEFIDCGIKNDGKPRPRTMDWEQDAPIIIPAVNKVNNAEVRATDYMHWWTFFGLYMEIGESTFSTVVSIRDKRFYAANFNAPCVSLVEGEEKLDELSFQVTSENPVL